MATPAPADSPRAVRGAPHARPCNSTVAARPDLPRATGTHRRVGPHSQAGSTLGRRLPCLRSHSLWRMPPRTYVPRVPANVRCLRTPVALRHDRRHSSEVRGSRRMSRVVRLTIREFILLRIAEDVDQTAATAAGAWDDAALMKTAYDHRALLGAVRDLVDLHVPIQSRCETCQVAWPCNTIRTISRAWADHPDAKVWVSLDSDGMDSSMPPPTDPHNATNLGNGC